MNRIRAYGACKGLGSSTNKKGRQFRAAFFAYTDQENLDEAKVLLAPAAVGQKAHAQEPKDHHGPGRGFWNASYQRIARHSSCPSARPYGGVARPYEVRREYKPGYVKKIGRRNARNGKVQWARTWLNRRISASIRTTGSTGEPILERSPPGSPSALTLPSGEGRLPGSRPSVRWFAH
jgi:hypothetical protein